MASRKRSPARRAHVFKQSVHVTAKLVLSPDNDRGDIDDVESVFVGESNSKPCLKAAGSCGDEQFVCFLDEIPQLIAFLSDVHKASVAK